MSVKGRGVLIDIDLLTSSPRKRGPILRGGNHGVGASCLRLLLASAAQIDIRGYGSPRSRGRRRSMPDGSSRHRKAQRLAAAAHVDGGKAGDGEAAGAAVALLVDLELALAGA